jgi:hypothetical protein
MDLTMRYQPLKVHHWPTRLTLYPTYNILQCIRFAKKTNTLLRADAKATLL